MLNLPNVTFLGIDCVNLKRLQLAADISSKEVSFAKIKLLSSIKSSDSRVVSIKKISTKEAYSDFLIKELHKYVDTEFVLIFQHDGLILNPGAWDDNFLKYDYIGAPWYHLGDLHVGNGGFSLRSKKMIDWLANNWNKIPAKIHPEDVFISKFARPYLEKERMNFAPEDVASRFAMEGNRKTVVWNGEFGVHGLGYTDISNWHKTHPEYKNILNYKLDDYTTLMAQYPICDGTRFTMDFKSCDMGNYVRTSKNKKRYEARITQDKYFDLSNIKEGNTLIFKRSGVSFKKVPIPAFERKIKRIEHFDNFKMLRTTYPKMEVTYPILGIKKWLRPFLRFLGDYPYTKNKEYSVFWFE
jgi:hypothetical protein